MNNQLLQHYKRHLTKAISHLEYSFNKVQKLSTDVSKMDEETLETWEGLCSRFARVSEIFLTKYLRTKILIEDPGFNGTFRDLLNQSEKLNLITDAKLWIKIRVLRNREAYEYTEETLGQFFSDIKSLTPNLIDIKNVLKTSNDTSDGDDGGDGGENKSGNKNGLYSVTRTHP